MDLKYSDISRKLQELFDNKIMMNVPLPDRLADRPLPHAVALNVGEPIQQQQHQQTMTTTTTSQTTKSSSCWRKFRTRLRAPCLIDVLIAVLVLSVMGLIELGVIPNTKLGFICKDPMISYPFRGDTITATTLLVTAYFGPLGIITLIEALREKSLKRVCVGTIWNYYKECLIGTTLVLLVTEVIKVIVGEQRPHFFDTCEPDTNRYCQPGSFILDYNCTNTRISNYLRTDVARSFPSGHTSISIFVALYCSFLIQTRLPYLKGALIKPFLISVCLSWSLLCSLTRITDRRHHWWDVLAGAFLGICGAFYTVTLLHRRDNNKIVPLVRTDTTTTLLDVKNKDATSVII